MKSVGILFVLATVLVAPVIGGGWHGNLQSKKQNLMWKADNGPNGQGGPQAKPDCAENSVPNQSQQNNFNNRPMQPSNNQAQHLNQNFNGNGNNKQSRQFEGQQLNAIPQSFQKPQFRSNNQQPANFNQQQPRPNQNNAPPLSPCEQWKLQQNRQQGFQGSGKPFTEFFSNGNGRGNLQQGSGGNQQNGFNGNQQQQGFDGNQQQGFNGNQQQGFNGNQQLGSNGSQNNGYRNGNNGQQGLSQQQQGFSQQQFGNNGQRFINLNQNFGQQPLQNNPCPQG